MLGSHKPTTMKAIQLISGNGLHSPFCKLTAVFYVTCNLSITTFGGARGVVVIAVGNEHGDTSSNPGRY